MIRYVTALIIAAAIILAGIVFVRRTYAGLNARFEEQRQRWKQQKADGTLPESMKDVDLDAIQLKDTGMMLTTDMQVRLDVAAWLADFWYVFIPLVVVVCLCAAYAMGRVFHRRTG